MRPADAVRSIGSALVPVALVLGAFMSTPVAAGSDHPTTGMVHNTADNSSLTYRCTAMDAGTIECEFVQTSVRKNAKPEELDKVLAEAKRDFPREKPFQKADCDQYAEILEIVDGKKAPPKLEALTQMSAREKASIREFATATVRLCREWSEANYLALITFNHQKECQTCRVASNTFRQRLRRQASGSGPARWVALSEPTGDCGTVQLDRFEVDEAASRGSNSYVWWNYFARKAITIPTGKNLLGMSCADLDQREYRFDWKSKGAIPLDCIYISFTAI